MSTNAQTYKVTSPFPIRGACCFIMTGQQTVQNGGNFAFPAIYPQPANALTSDILNIEGKVTISNGGQQINFRVPGLYKLDYEMKLNTDSVLGVYVDNQENPTSTCTAKAGSWIHGSVTFLVKTTSIATVRLISGGPASTQVAGGNTDFASPLARLTVFKIY